MQSFYIFAKLRAISRKLMSPKMAGASGNTKFGQKGTYLNVNETVIADPYSSFVRMAPEEHCVLFVYRRSFFTLAGVCKNQRA